MPEYLAPGVFVEETSFRPKSIQGVATSTTAFVGPTRRGPIGMASDVITSFGEFERLYGGLGDLVWGGSTRAVNYMAHAVKAYFDNGGARLYVARTFSPRAIDGATTRAANSAGAAVAGLSDPPTTVGTFRARAPGAGGNGVVVAHQKAAPASAATLNAAPLGALARTGTGAAATYFEKTSSGWRDAADAALDLASLPAGTALITLNLELLPGAANRRAPAEGGPIVLEGLGFGSAHPRALATVLPATPSSRSAALAQPYWFDQAGGTTAFQLREALFPAGEETVFALTGGDDGAEPLASSDDAEFAGYAAALAALEEVWDVAIVAAPGHSALASTTFQAVQGQLLSHAQRLGYRFAVLDTPPRQGVGDAREVRGRISSTYGALYYPWVIVANPGARPADESIPKELALPPSGFMCGIYARNDIERGVWKAPANEVVRGALRFEREVSRGEQEVLNPEGINCLRSFFGRGHRVWGARTVSTDPEWIYVNVRRYFLYLGNSIDRSTQWAVFEPNGPMLWANIRDTITSFLFAEWKTGALLGATPEAAFFVRCDRSTMTQADLDAGRLICEIGVAVVKPAEFVIFRIGQKTASAQN
ncbi:MAG: phage tail sheath family protein [Geminicoccaceae bacterium]|nr:MAG: phage tail sheath family protein [Geminicoccaceae bacterium]